MAICFTDAEIAKIKQQAGLIPLGDISQTSSKRNETHRLMVSDEAIREAIERITATSTLLRFETKGKVTRLLKASRELGSVEQVNSDTYKSTRYRATVEVDTFEKESEAIDWISE